MQAAPGVHHPRATAGRQKWAGRAVMATTGRERLVLWALPLAHTLPALLKQAGAHPIDSNRGRPQRVLEKFFERSVSIEKCTRAPVTGKAPVR